LSAMINRISASAATAAFVVYAALEGLLFSSIFLAYTGTSIATTFFATSLTFGVSSLVGYMIKADLTGFGRFLLFGLIGFLIGSVINIFWANSGFDVFLTYAGIFLFAGLAAYDTQKIKMMSLNAGEMAREDGRKLAVVGALMLYLDFINLFLLLLRVFGGRRD
ncbi:MAG: Bax inhibitor-1/YccA family protein, partial [Lentisphaeria bacterium]|nr:Bax inhibitor-1/YccA family protein [Lentisphaeria bacterium]